MNNVFPSAAISEYELRSAYSQKEIAEMVNSKEEPIVAVDVYIAAPTAFGPVAYQVTTVEDRCVRVCGLVAQN